MTTPRIDIKQCASSLLVEIPEGNLEIPLKDVIKFVKSSFGIDITEDDATLIIQELKQRRSDLANKIANHGDKIEAPEDPFKLRTMRVLSRDRNDWIAETKIGISPKWSGISLTYNINFQSESENNIPFNDDHYRAINRQFTNHRGRPGGRDDRKFRVNRSKEAEELLTKLQKRKSEINDEIRRIKRNSYLINPVHIVPVIDRETTTIKYESDDTRSTRTDSFTKYFVKWCASEEKEIHRLKSPRVLARSALVSSYEEAEQIQNGETPDEASKARNELQKQYDAFLEESGINKLETELEEIKNALKQFENPDALVVDINLYPSGSTEHDGFLNELMDEKVISFPNYDPNMEKVGVITTAVKAAMPNSDMNATSGPDKPGTPKRPKKDKLSKSVSKKQKLIANIEKTTDLVLEEAREILNDLVSSENAEEVINRLRKIYLDDGRSDDKPGNQFAWRKSNKDPVIERISPEDLEEIVLQIAEEYE